MIKNILIIIAIAGCIHIAVKTWLTFEYRYKQELIKNEVKKHEVKNMKKTLDKIANEILKRKLQKQINALTEDLNKDNYDMLFKKISELKIRQMKLSYLLENITIH